MTKSDVLGLMACDGVGVQWQNGDCVGLLWFWRCCAEPTPLFLAALRSSSLLLCLYVNLRILPRIYLQEYFLHSICKTSKYNTIYMILGTSLPKRLGLVRLSSLEEERAGSTPAEGTMHLWMRG